MARIAVLVLALACACDSVLGLRSTAIADAPDAASPTNVTTPYLIASCGELYFADSSRATAYVHL